jgi:hypothetical protein
MPAASVTRWTEPVVAMAVDEPSKPSSRKMPGSSMVRSDQSASNERPARSDAVPVTVQFPENGKICRSDQSSETKRSPLPDGRTRRFGSVGRRRSASPRRSSVGSKWPEKSSGLSGSDCISLGGVTSGTPEISTSNSSRTEPGPAFTVPLPVPVPSNRSAMPSPFSSSILRASALMVPS